MNARPQLTASVIRLPNGRDLSFCEFGDPSGLPVFGFHGTPGSRLQLTPTSTSPLPPGYRLIVPDRPGYGHSSFYPERRLIDWPGDVAALADYLDIDRFAVFGVSGGGPHALVCAHALGQRLLGVACVSGVGPLADPDAAKGMLALNRVMTMLARNAKWVLNALMGMQVRFVRRNPTRALELMAKQLPTWDQVMLSDGEFRASLIEDFRSSSATAGRAAAQDFALFCADWGFRLADIAAPVHFWQGGVDRNVPARHAELMSSKTPGAILHRYPDEGHFLVVRRLPEILATITSAPAPERTHACAVVR